MEGNLKGNGSNTKDEIDEKFYDAQNTKTDYRICCVCHTAPRHTKFYYGRLFCVDCFHKYIWSAPQRDCSGDVKDRKKESEPFENIGK